MDDKKLVAIKDFIISAEKSIHSAKKILATMMDSKDFKKDLVLDTGDLHAYDSGEDKIVEGVFTGEAMLGADGNIYPIPQNYASKSRLVQGSKVKAIIKPDGKMLYKIIEEIKSETQIGLLTKSGDKFQVIAEGKTYNVLLAAVTYIKGEVGDKVSIKVPEGKEATFAAIESIIPK